MAKVNAEIKRILREKDAGIRSGAAAARAILKELQRQVTDDLGRAALGSWNAYQLKQLLDSIERHVADFDIQVRKEAEEYLDDAWDKGQELVYKPLNVAGIYTGFDLGASVLTTYKDFTFHKLSGLSNDAWNKIKGELLLGMNGAKTPQQVAAAIGPNLKNPSIFKSIAERAEVITKTEMGRVFSQATQLRMDQAAKHVKGLEKQWKHAGHPKQPRPTHLAAHDQHVPVNEAFLIGGVIMRFPRDPAAPLNEVIRCGCDHVPWHAKWSD